MMLRSFLSRRGEGRSSKRGFTLVELAIVLAVASLMFAGLWRLMAGGNAQMRDQAASDQMKQLMKATQDYLGSTDGMNNYTKSTNAVKQLPLPAACPGGGTFCDYLPAGFNLGTVNSYGQTYQIWTSPETAAGTGNYSFMIETQGGDVISDMDGSRIAGMIGAEGGFIYGTMPCGAGNACGAYGGWAVNPTTYGLPPVAGLEGHIVTRSTPSYNSEGPWLARNVLLDAFGSFNVMSANMFFGAAPPVAADFPSATGPFLYLQGNRIYMGTTGAGGSPLATGGGGGIYLQDGIIDGGPALAATPYAGTIQNVHSLTVGMNAAGDNSALVVNGAVSASCPPLTPSDATLCHYALTVNGSASVTGLLTANVLYAQQFIYSSDFRLKKNIKPLEHVLDDMAKIKAVSFSMKGGEEKKYGILAQDVEKVYPQLVHSSGDGFKGVDYMGLIGPLIGAVNELKSENDKLRQQMQEQTSAIRRLEKQSQNVK